MQIDGNSILAAIGEVLAEERSARIALQARVDEMMRLAGPPGERGLPGEPGADGERGEPGPAGERGLPGEAGRDGRDGLHGLTGERGERGERGEPGDMGATGQAGPTGAVGERGEAGQPAYPGRACGLWSEAGDYRAMDVVVHNGSEWRAVYDNPGPLPGEGWMLGAKGVKGKPGERGEKGDRGEKGERGMSGVSVIKAMLVDFDIVFLLSDGTRLTCNLLPAIERYYQEAVA